MVNVCRPGGVGGDWKSEAALVAVIGHGYNVSVQMSIAWAIYVDLSVDLTMHRLLHVVGTGMDA